MYKRINCQLRVIYTLMTGCILTAVVIIVFFLSENQRKMNQKELFQNNVYSIALKLQTENNITNTWLSTMEMKNNMLIYIEDNGHTLLSHGTWLSQDIKDEIVSKAKRLAKDDGLDISVPPVSYRDLKTNYYHIDSSDGMKFYTSVILIPKGEGFRSAVLFQYINRPFYFVVRQVLIFLIIDIIGVAALYFVSKILIDKTLYPVEEGRKKQTEFIAAASHELKSPLSVIQTSASAILRVPEKVKHYTVNIESECRRMARLIDDLLILTTTDAKQWLVKESLIQLDSILIDTYEIYEQVCKNNGINLIINLPEEILPNVYGDSMRIKQALMILLDNAISHSESKEELKLRAYMKKNFVYIEIIDYGIGIPDEYKEMIFERFYRLDNSRNNKQHFGLGLSIARELMQLHGGTLNIYDTDGGGCTFIIKLPKAGDNELR